MLKSPRHSLRRTSKLKLALGSGLLLLAAALYALYAWTASPAETIELGQAQTVQTTKPLVCAHTLLENEVEEWKIQRTLELVREMGATAIVQFFPWAYFEPEAGRYSWRQADLIVRHAKNQGLRIIARLGLVPEWARPAQVGQATTFNFLPEAAFADFAAFSARLAARYRETIQHFIVWNEPNLSFEWGYRPVDPAAYARLLQATYPALKEANPRALVLAGALAPTNEGLDSNGSLKEILYLRELYRHGAAPYFDALAVHSYGGTEPPDAAPAAERLNFRRLELQRQIMLEYDDAAKPVFITESGWNDHARWTGAVRPAQRLQYTIDVFEYVRKHWSWVQQLCIWAFRFPAPVYGYPDNFTLVSPEFDKKPIYYALQDYARGWVRGREVGSDASAVRWLPPPEGA